MKILAVIPFTGSEKLVSMTEDCIEKLVQCQLPEDVTVDVLAVNNAASRELDEDKINSFPRAPGWGSGDQLKERENVGFGVAVNRAIDYWLISERQECDAILVLNNDLQFPSKDWLRNLLHEYEEPYVLAPTTDITASDASRYAGPVDNHAILCREVSAYCWLVPARVVRAIDVRFSWPLFNPMFTNYGSDEATAAILRKLYGATPFKVVRRSWVKHLKAQTANELGVKAGTQELLKQLKSWKVANKLK